MRWLSAKSASVVSAVLYNFIRLISDAIKVGPHPFGKTRDKR